MNLKGKKIIALAGIVAVMATGCGKAADGNKDSGNAELDRFMAANVEQSCYVKDFVGDKDPSTFTEEQLKGLQEKSLEILRDNGFDVLTVDDAMALSQRLYDQSVADGSLEAYDEKFIEAMLKKECITAEEAASMRAARAASTQPVVETPALNEADATTETQTTTTTTTSATPGEAEAVPADELPVDEDGLPPEVPPTM